MSTQRIYRGGLQFHDHPAGEKHMEPRLHDGYWRHCHDEGGMVAVGEDGPAATSHADDFIMLHAVEAVDISGRGLLHIVEGGSGIDPDDLRGRVIMLDGEAVRVQGVCTFAIGRPYPPDLPFGLLVAGDGAPS